jgi:hypothetical protein
MLSINLIKFMHNSHLHTFFTRVTLLGAVLMMFLITAPVAQATITVQNYYRMGENDPGAADKGRASSLQDAVGG